MLSKLTTNYITNEAHTMTTTYLTTHTHANTTPSSKETALTSPATAPTNNQFNSAFNPMGGLFGGSNGSSTMMMILMTLISSLLEQMTNDANASARPENTTNSKTSAGTTVNGSNTTPNANCNTTPTTTINSNEQPNETHSNTSPGGLTPPKPVLSAEDKAVVDYVNNQQGKWLVTHGTYIDKSSGQDVYQFSKGPLKGYTAHHTGDGKFDIRNPSGKKIAEHQSPKENNKVASPVAFDLNNDGKIGTTGETTAQNRLENTKLGSTVQFDIDGDGNKDTIEWMKGDGDALLVNTAKIGPDNQIDGNALFGDQGGKFANGYEKLKLHDTNNDGKISGDELKNLAAWVDNGDAKLESSELRTLDQLGIKEISVEKQDVQNERGESLMRSTAQTTAGETIMTEDVWFGQA